jgi:hypothetical protein
MPDACSGASGLVKRSAVFMMTAVPCRLVRQVRKIGEKRLRFAPIWFTSEASSPGSDAIMRIAGEKLPGVSV